jgi:hypothetical protein
MVVGASPGRRGEITGRRWCGLESAQGDSPIFATLLRRVPAKIGYEYTDIGRAHWNGLVGGLRLWF